MPLALTGSLTAVQFCYPAELPLTLNKLKRFETGPYFSIIITKERKLKNMTNSFYFRAFGREFIFYPKEHEFQFKISTSIEVIDECTFLLSALLYAILLTV